MKPGQIEKEKRAGGAFRYAGKTPLFQEVEANEASFERNMKLLSVQAESRRYSGLTQYVKYHILRHGSKG